MMQRSDAMEHQWLVERWGGQARHKTRVIFIGSEDLARQRYAKEATALRQGSVRLVRGFEIVERTVGGRNRTRW